jgi:DNA-binding MarR family transcriptional regulator
MSDPRRPAEPEAERLRVPGAAFLLSQVGFHSSRLWGERIARLELDPREVVLLRHVAAAEGQSQQALAAALQIPPSRMVALVDALEQRGLLERRPISSDRRVRALHLSRQGGRELRKIMAASAEHEAELCAGLEASEREQLIALLSRLAAEQGLPTGVHPGVADEASRRRRRHRRSDAAAELDTHPQSAERSSDELPERGSR